MADLMVTPDIGSFWLPEEEGLRGTAHEKCLHGLERQ